MHGHARSRTVVPRQKFCALFFLFTFPRSQVHPSSSYVEQIVSTIKDIVLRQHPNISTSGAIWPSIFASISCYGAADAGDTYVALGPHLVKNEVSTTRRQPLIPDDEGKFVDPPDTTPPTSIFIFPLSYSYFDFFLRLCTRTAELAIQPSSVVMPCH